MTWRFPALLSFSLIVALPAISAAAPHILQVTGSSGNLVAGRLMLDSPDLNGKPSANLIVTQNYAPVGVYNQHVSTADAEQYLSVPVGVGYNRGLKRWFIYAEDLGGIPSGASFNILVTPCATVNATPLNSYGAETVTSVAKGNSDAILLLTHLFDPNGTLPSGLFVNHNLGIGYDSDSADGSAYKHWYIATEDASPPEPATYFLYNATADENARHANAFVEISPAQTNTVSVTSGTLTGGIQQTTNIGGIALSDPLINGNPNAVIFVTHDLTGDNTMNAAIGVYYNGASWSIISPNFTQFYSESLNVLAFDSPVP